MNSLNQNINIDEFQKAMIPSILSKKRLLIRFTAQSWWWLARVLVRRNYWR